VAFPATRRLPRGNGPVRVWAAGLSAVLTMLGLSLLEASHPPAAATMLLVALGGSDPSWHTAVTIVAGVLILALPGEGLRYLRREAVRAPPKAAP
jgi:CBS-domain-containing membrane protein